MANTIENCLLFVFRISFFIDIFVDLLYYSFTGKTINFVNQTVQAEYNSVGTGRNLENNLCFLQEFLT